MTATISPFTQSNFDNLRRAALISNRYLKLILMPTEKCNFRCTYCYEDFTVGRMKEETITGVKALIDRRSIDLEHLQISWFGGEPLIAKDIVFEISEYAMNLTRKYPKLRYEGDMTTNAYFLDYNTTVALADVGIKSYQISLDGPREIHNKSRIRADGSGTYDKIWENLLAIRNSSLPVSVVLRIHFTVDTIQMLEPLIDNIKKEFISDSRFSIFFKAIERLGGSNDESIKILSEAEKEQVVQLLKNKLVGETTPSESLFAHSHICYASQPNSLVIRSNGDVGKCTVALYDERNKIASLQPDGMLKLIPGRLAPWLRGIETLDPATLACPLVNLT
ncbi:MULTISPECIES: radical SAM protein [Nostoc]|uniref:Radical SAM protein n=1 Tax=Nostoc paludosum FACHB-159 TaxID=2692908 RepID=A0ABR8KK99_9NOSO|nr:MULTISPECIES: radical SAM protein [Nostoc]MBD2679336.1 radical SAM protein [Nostoc sp. FACHB-857]MBD2738563.1 radical SAM protein [Nostoc paludosum FACHB-159]